MTSRLPDPDPARWELIETICLEAMELPSEERAAFLEDRCRGDRDLRDRVRTLLKAMERSPAFMERPVLSIPGEGEGTPELPAETRVGRYRLIRPLGHGGMGDVYLASYQGDGFERTVALKVIRKGLDTRRVMDRFRLERRILAGLRHPNIAQLLDGGTTADGRPFFVMEFVEGEPLDTYCERRRLSTVQRLALVETVCDAVHHAHRNLVVHRDIKPQNILVTEDGRPKLLDFGIGKLLSAEPGTGDDLTRAEDRALTPDYAAPELLAGEPVTTAVDVYGLGVLLYRILSGRLPYPPGRSRAELLAQRDRPPARLVDASPDGRRVSRELDAVVLKAMSRDSSERYGSVAALADDLRRFREGRPVRARAPGPLYSARKFIGRHRVAVAAGAVVFVSLVGAGLYSLDQSRRVAAERDRALEVRGFLLETFGAAGADRAVGESVTARALLDGQAAAMRDAYAGRPELQAEMMLVLAEGYERLGLFPEALAWAQEALALAQAGPPGDRAASAALVGWITHQMGRPGDALPVLEGAVADARRDRGAGRALARALNDLGVVQEALGDFEAAGDSHREAMALRVALFGGDHRSVAVSASNLSVIRYRQGDLEGAVREAETALRVVRASLGPDHQRAIIIQSNLAVFKLVAGDLAGAEADFRDLWERQARIQGPEHPVTVRVMSSLASVLRQREKWMEAESVLREVVRIMEGWDDPSPTDLATTLANLGDVVSARGGFAEGRALLMRALEMQEDVLGREHVDAADTRLFLSRLYERADSMEQAVRWRREAVATLGSALGANSRPALDQELELGLLLARAGRPGEARDVLTGMRDRVERLLDRNDPLGDRIRRALADTAPR